MDRAKKSFQRSSIWRKTKVAHYPNSSLVTVSLGTSSPVIDSTRAGGFFGASTGHLSCLFFESLLFFPAFYCFQYDLGIWIIGTFKHLGHRDGILAEGQPQTYGLFKSHLNELDSAYLGLNLKVLPQLGRETAAKRNLR